MNVPSIFESINARSLSPYQVASRFVPPRQFDILIQRNSTVVVGPRGSGKTTLLKMLQQPALEYWTHPKAERIRQQIDFTGVFIATDITWAEQIAALGEGELDAPSHQLLATSAFTTHTLRALIVAMLSRLGSPLSDSIQPYRRVSFDENTEARLVRDIAKVWKLSPSIPTLLATKQALTARLVEIKEIASRERYLREDDRKDRLAEMEFLHLHFLEAARYGTEIFNDLAKEPDEKWALLFDELELAPSWIRERLRRYLRSTESRFLFKLAFSPSNPDFDQMKDPLDPSARNDYEQIPLWYAEKRHGYEFCQSLWHSILNDRGMKDRDPWDILGFSVFETPYEEYRNKDTAYRPDSRWGRLFVDLGKRDKTFLTFLQRRGIDIKALDKVPRDQRASDLRKAAPIIALREFYRAAHQKSMHIKGQKSRSRKTASIYSGSAALFAITEGNPRWFIGLVNRLLDHLSGSLAKVSPELQGVELQKVSERFQAMIKTIPLSQERRASSDNGVLGVLEKIGAYFYDQAVVADFSPDPPATFVVDEKLDKAIVTSIEKALNAGAIVYVPELGADLILTSVAGKRFRLSYLLAPSFGIPLRLGPSVLLSKILANTDGLRRPGQLDLLQEEGL